MVEVVHPPFCQGCGATLEAADLRCPSCRRIIYSEIVDELLGEADRALEAGFRGRAIGMWQSALRLLPSDSTRAASIEERLTAETTPKAEFTSAATTESPGVRDSEPKPAWRKWLGPFGLVLAGAWKFKGLLLLVLSKAKFVLFGFSKAGTVLSMLATFGLYLTVYGWKFALGLVLSIYLHEMGHVAAFKRLGIPVSSPMFIPGFGAFVRGQAVPRDVEQNAQISLAGPLWGLVTALVCFALAALTGSPLWTAIAVVGAQINLLNLIPALFLDGHGAIQAMGRNARFIAAGVAAVMMFATGVGIYLFILVGFAYHFWKRQYPEQPSTKILVHYLGMLVALGIMSSIPVDIRSAG